MKRNIGDGERFIRVLAGSALLAMTFVGPRALWGYLGLVPLLTGLIGWCPPYQILGISTCSRKKEGLVNSCCRSTPNPGNTMKASPEK